MSPIAPAFSFDKQDTAARRSLWRSLASSGNGRLGLALAAIMLAVIGLGPWLAPYPPTQIGLGLPNQFPTWAHPFGTDDLGRDILSRFLVGGRSVILVPFVAVVLSTVVGGWLGIVSAYAQIQPRLRWIDQGIASLLDLALALPPLLLALVLIAGFGTSPPVLILSVAAIFAPRTGRILRGATQAVVTSDYVAAAQARGESLSYILLREVLPNIAATAIAEFALRMTWGIIFVASLSFLGLGAQPPSSDWGLMVAQARPYITVSPIAVLAPAAGIALLSVALNLIADALADHLDPASGQPGVPL
ncbi:ABC transporter permease [Rhizobium sp. YJ-22]|uniref:ABC transporter permease n=1 Tax=Rhizobium sp. YJ-22 TaxID=3037556 RepID=UPI000A71E0EF|nr:ABC transporter permease [Rhizobium sp. YJ-22]MBN9028834.1 ABC transporter permease [Hyphomicrobiales bacterium]MDG3576499.1 ABC transporter permease [Rhizobium sp. YJ-22]